jgi:hypothetical protein
VPVITNAHAYGTEWVKWWAAAQPKERDTGQWPFSRSVDSDVGWRKFPANGKDGIFVAVMALSWWAVAAQSPEEIVFFEEAVTDIHWVIQELICIKTTNGLSPSPPPSPQDEPTPHLPRHDEPMPRPPVSTSKVPIHQRAVGKRVVRPTEKALAIS